MKRRHWVLIHRWVALVFAAHWLLLALTGMLLVFHREIETAWMGAAPAVKGPAPIDAAIAAAQKAAPGQASRVVIQDAPIRALRVFVDGKDDRHIVTVDAASDRILSMTPVNGGASPSGIVRYVYRLHQQLLLGDNGEVLVGISGLFLCLTAGAGLWLGWPRRGQWKRTLWPRVAGKRWQKFYVLHRSAGLVVGAVLILSALSGAGMVWGKGIRSLLGGVGLAQAAPPVPAPVPDADAPVLISPDAAVSHALAAYPDAAFSRLDLPKPGKGGAYVVQMRQPGELRASFGTTSVAVSGQNGAILWRRDSRQAPWGDAIVDGLFAIHNGEWLALPGRLLMALAGMMLAATAFLGLGTWLLRPSRR